ncbi:superoxide dismutase [Mesorhizobium soli]|uniref:Fe-Mn family superoxide dismutase n=1 Tax=Pseudaminobacter soli (ex Li et al. 2025) TaxID=1295366 RepID=UPI00247575A9|nr:Fe-Mn family superoxide dismutase [Mesorhizobium soli]MDH6231784.1 superoxide dismutase [Mesorhizobium soli]
MHQIIPLPFKPNRLDGLCERLLASHYENNYGGAVRRLNAIERRLDDLDWGTAPIFDINGLKREELVAANSAILHEIYFEGLGGSSDVRGDLTHDIERDFGSVARWRIHFTACAKAQAGGSGWTLLTWSERHRRLLIHLEAKEDIALLDVCLADVMAKRHDMLPGALVRAPEKIAGWAGDLPTDKPIIVYGIYGLRVSADVAAELRRRGLDAHNPAGGIAAWHAIGAPTVPLSQTEGR